MNNVKTKNSPNMRFVPLINIGFSASYDIEKILNLMRAFLVINFFLSTFENMKIKFSFPVYIHYYIISNLSY